MSKPVAVPDAGPMLEGQQRERPPVAGFWVRCIAFILDVILLHFFAYAMVFVLKEQLLALGKVAPYLGLAIIFCYFWLANGPVGKGKTIGKTLFNITTLRYDGQPLELKEALIRTLVQLSFLLLVLVVIPLFFGNILSQTARMMSHSVETLAMAFLIANAVLIGVQPFKQGFHDLLARSYVAKDPARLSEERLVGTPDERMAKWRRSAFQSAGIAFIVVLVISLYNVYRNIYSEDMKRSIRLTQESRALFNIKGFEPVILEGVLLPSEDEKSMESRDRGEESRDSDVATSPGAPEAEPKKYALAFRYVRYGSIDAEALKQDPYIPVLLEEARGWVQEKMRTDLSDLSEKGVVTEQVMFIFEESLNLVIYVYGNRVYETSLPLELDNVESPSSATQP